MGELLMQWLPFFLAYAPDPVVPADTGDDQVGDAVEGL